jgi:hypothetical protein
MGINSDSMFNKSLISNKLSKSTKTITPDSKSKTPNFINIIKFLKSPSINYNSSINKSCRMNKDCFSNLTQSRKILMSSINKSTNINFKSKPIT